MPEFPEILAFVQLIRKGKGFPGSSKRYQSLKFFVQIIPLCLSLGSAKRSFECLHANKGNYTPSSQNATFDWLPAEWPPHSWRRRAEEPWSYLLDPPQKSGELVCTLRGKLLVIAAGNHAVAISLGLEAHVFGMRPSDFYEIIKKDVAGPNPDATKAEKIRTFLIPERLIVPGSSSNRPRCVKIFAAFISAEWVYVLSDFTGLARMFVKSKKTPWTSDDLSPGTMHWNDLFEAFTGGPDWILEKPLAMKVALRWRNAVLNERAKWQRKVYVQQTAYTEALQEYNATQRLEFFFGEPSRAVLTFDPPSPPVFAVQPCRPIIREICANSLGAFSGFGRHTANDFLFTQAIFPGMPSYLLCEDDEVFNDFVSAIEAYIKSYATDEYFKRVVCVPNSVNPFAFSESSNAYYMKRYILVFRRAKTKVGRNLYIRYCRLGYLDPNHTMGQPYPSEKADAKIQDAKRWTILPVYLFDGIKAYSIIKAQCPSDWTGRSAPWTKRQVKKDIAAFGYNTTIGLAQFHEHVLNRVVPVIKIKGGRPQALYSGKKGRPPKVKSTKKDLDAAWAKRLGRKYIERPKGQTIDWASTDEDDPLDVDVNIFMSDDDVEGTMNIDAQTERIDRPVQDLDADDNAGDADAAGDGSAYIGDRFVDYDNSEGPEDLPGPMSEPSVLCAPKEDLDGILRDARRVIYLTHPYDNDNMSFKVDSGIMTYKWAHTILQKWDILKSKHIAPFVSRRRHLGTTIPNEVGSRQ